MADDGMAQTKMLMKVIIREGDDMVTTHSSVSSRVAKRVDTK